MRKLPVASDLVALAVGVVADAQPAEAPAPRAASTESVAPPPREAKGKDAAAKGKDEPAESPRMAKLKALAFDRRPSSRPEGVGSRRRPTRDKPRLSAKEKDAKDGSAGRGTGRL